MGGLLTVPAFLERFPQLNIVDNNNFHDAWVTGTSCAQKGFVHMLT
jgi:hypothetical protein